MNVQEFKDTLTQKGPKHVYEQILLNEDVHILKLKFKEKSQEIYHNLKIAVSNELDVQLKNVAIVGSAKIGYSLTPTKNFRAFNDESDLDLVIVCPSLFKEIWDNYFKYSQNFSSEPYAHVAKNIFKHHISVKAEDIDGEKLKYFKDWLEKISKLKLRLQTEFKTPAEVNYRIYDDWGYVEKYHIAGLNKILEAQ